MFHAFLSCYGINLKMPRDKPHFDLRLRSSNAFPTVMKQTQNPAKDPSTARRLPHTP